MKLEAVPLFVSWKEVSFFGILLLLVLSVSLGKEYRQYRKLTRFDDAEVNATVLQQYGKEKEGHRYQVLKLRLDGGPDVFTTASQTLRDLSGYRVRFWLHTDRIGFLDYLKGFFAQGYIKAVSPSQIPKYRAGTYIRSEHTDAVSGEIFAALFASTPISPTIRHKLSALGISHLLAISGFHIGLLGLILFWLLRYPYRLLQSRWFPWRNMKRDLFVLTSLLLFMYAFFLQFPPSVLRSFAMMLAGFFFYDRGIRVLSLQSLMIVVFLLLSLWPALLFSLGFWLSVGGVYSIFTFLQLSSGVGPVVRFVGLHVWVYLMMLPWTLVLFGTFSSWHPVSIVLTMGFVLFYPLALSLHLVGMGDLLDTTIQGLMQLSPSQTVFDLDWKWLLLWLVLNLLALESQTVKWLLFGFAGAVFVGAVYQVA